MPQTPKMPESKTFLVWEYREFEALVQQTYGRGYEFTADMEASNDTTHQFTVPGEGICAFDQSELARFKAGSHGIRFLAPVLLNDMAAQGIIPKGDYLIKVSW